MKDLSVYDFSSYKRYIKAWIAARPSRGRGEKRQIALKVGCNSAYVSHVLERNGHFSLEQAALLSQYIDHNVLEARFFLLVVQYERAGHEVLKAQLKAQMDEICETRVSTRHRLEHGKGLSVSEQAIYFSTWHYIAAHQLLGLSSFHTRDAIAERLRISTRKAGEILDFLVASGLARHENGTYSYGPVQVFVPEASPLSSKSHVNWRLKAMASLDQPMPEDLHLTLLATANENDLPAIRVVLMKAFENVREIVRKSENENTLVCIDLDFFRP